MKKPPELTEIAEKIENPPNYVEADETTDFDWSAVSRHLREPQPMMDESDEPHHECARALRVLFDWLAPEKDPRKLGVRLLALMWVMDPGRLEGMSLRKLALDRGITPGELSTATALFSRRFGLKTGAQSHDWRPHARD